MTRRAIIDSETERAASLFLELVGSKFDVDHAVLFGSRARQTHKPDSDADLAVFLRGEHSRFLPVKLAMADLAFDVLLETGILIQPLPIWEDEWSAPAMYSNPQLLKNIADEGVRL